VFETIDKPEALVVQGLLESNGIESLIIHLEAPPDVLPGVGGFAIRVRFEDAEDARCVIEEQRNAPLDEEESSETEAP